MYKPSLWLRGVGALDVVLAAVTLRLALPPILHFDMATVEAGAPAVKLVDMGLLGFMLLGMALDRFPVPRSMASLMLLPFFGVAVGGIIQLAGV